jgi:hypothetical protein
MQSGICGHLKDELRTFGFNGLADRVNRIGRDCT